MKMSALADGLWPGPHGSLTHRQARQNEHRGNVARCALALGVAPEQLDQCLPDGQKRPSIIADSRGLQCLPWQTGGMGRQVMSPICRLWRQAHVGFWQEGELHWPLQLSRRLSTATGSRCRARDRPQMFVVRDCGCGIVAAGQELCLQWCLLGS